MGKILKYCSSCEEGFAERFAFCPDCGAPLQAVEMNPLDQIQQQEAVVEAAAHVEPEAPAFIAESVEPESFHTSGPTDYEIAFATARTEEIPAVVDELDEPVVEEEQAVPATAAFYRAEPMHADEPRKLVPSLIFSANDDGGYHITVIQEKNVGQRNLLLLGSAVFMCTLALVAWGVSLFQKDLDVGSIGDNRSLALLLEEVPMPVDEVEQKKEKDDAGGGGGGGREDPEDVNQGDMADQTPDPIRPPDAKVHRMDDPQLVMPPPSTEGNKKFPKEYDKWGDPSKFGTIASNGPGTGGGLGYGDGTGQGSGTGTGAGSGSGSGYGAGNGNGNGNGTGDGDSGNPPPVRPPVTTAMRITSKTRAQYTDEARQNNVQGSVKLRVTFLASGQIGSVSVISGLPHGLTEKAIAAVKTWRFEPKLVNGQAQSTTLPVTVGFNIY